MNIGSFNLEACSNMAGEMDVLRLHGVGDLQLQTESIPEPAPGEVLIRVSTVGICGSDLHWFGEASIGDARISRPLVLGHEFSGIVEDPRSALHGQRVAIDPAIACRECEYCLDGNPNFCEQLHFAGHGVDDGALREYLTWPERNLYPLPETINDEEGALLEPLGVAIHAVELGKVQPGAAVGVFGVGPIGLMIVQLARLAGAGEILVTDRLNHRLETALAMGATRVFLVTDEWDRREIWGATGDRGVQAAFEAAGENQAVETAVEAAKPGGRVVLVGIPAQDWTAFTASTARRKGLTIKLSRRMRFTYPRAMQLVEDGLIDIDSLVTHQFPLSEFMRAFQVANQRDGLKVVLKL
ncbi:MAG TPA: alcohol dehydrogenase catalytic domain-containing protein [Anaerolineales bacterium]|nr:alcohol dehydrogenase catalytic domain-containing protein [Anaerolineales bacterium]